ncbi:hypothetical protein C8J57DRAFT_1732200 [Mycena rebaudengoi]|nr:hypothetical protein C8J57DRAFT_1732200 [Mycena rebaudengoi]
MLTDDLQELSAPCQKATFGVGQTDTLDEAYRKAGKMICCASGRRQNTEADNYVRAESEMYKLNVYGSSFKAHQDTPRRVDMIGSLVVIFPTAHAGSALTLEHDSTAWTFDSATQLSATAYVAFYSDVMHAVAPVETGYCATLTSTAKAPAHRAVPPPPEQAFAAALRALFADRTFLPTGGFLAYGFTH